MTLQIYWGDDFTKNRGYTMFDIEYYLIHSNRRTLNDKGELVKEWQSEIHVLPCVEGLTRYILSQKDNTDFNPEQFIEDSEEIQELRGWLWVFDGKNNRPDPETKLHYGERYSYIKNKLEEYAKKYGCFVSQD